MTANPDRPIRVVRLLVYTYANSDRMAFDMERWQVAANGCHFAGHDLTIRSATLPPEFIEPEPPDIVRKRGKVELIIAEARSLLQELGQPVPDDMHRVMLSEYLARAIAAYEADQ